MNAPHTKKGLAVLLTLGVWLSGATPVDAQAPQRESLRQRYPESRTGATTTSVAPAVAAANARLDTLRKNGIAAITTRRESIKSARVAFEGATLMTTDHKTAALALLDGSSSRLTETEGKINNARTLDELRPLLKAIVEDYRVYLVLLPQVHNAMASDSITNAAGKLESAASGLDAAVQSVGAAGINTAEIEASLTKAKSEAAAARGAVDGKATAALSLQATDYPGNRTKLTDVRNANKSGVEHLKASRDALAKARDTIQAVK